MLATALADQYRTLFNKLLITERQIAAVATFGNELLRGRDRYTIVQVATSVPWFVIGLIHGLEGSFSWHTHLHNGDPLTARTVHEPRGRPAGGQPPFTWEESAADALAFDRLTEWKQWDVAGIAYQLESYNGWGYRNRHHIASPYLWSMSNHYERGKYTSDGHFDANAVSQQVGAMTALHWLIDQKLVTLEDDTLNPSPQAA
jgi:lysozyme family protein